ncbi:MAG: DUF2442 domain-containing protein [Thermomicrobiales bacterium]
MFETVVDVKVVKPYVVEVTFDDGVQRHVDLESMLWGKVFEPLRDPEFFAQVRVDPELGTIVWPNGADLAPEILYYGEETPYGRVTLATPEEAAAASRTSL